MRGPRVVLVLACLAVFVVILDATIVAVALPEIRGALGVAPAELAWVFNAYMLVFAGFLLLGGRCADVFGHRATLLAGMAVFTAASATAGLAGSPAVLLAARAVQGLGGALLMPTTLAVLTASFAAGPARARALATWSMVGACGATAGTVLGGVLTEWAGWRWIFLVNLPVGVAVLGLVVVSLPPRSGGAHAGPRLDVVGAVLVTAGLTALVLGVMNAGEPGQPGPAVVVEVLGGIGLLAVFGLHQQRWAAHPLMPPSIFRIRAVSSANAVMFLVGLGFFASPVLLSLALQNVHGYPPLAAGLAFVPGAVGLVVGGRFAGRMAVALGTRRAAVAGLLTAAAGFAGLAVVLGLPALLPAAMAGSVAVFGLGVGTAFTPITIAATGGVSPDRYGTAAGLLNTVRQASGAIGLAALSAVAVGRGVPGASGSGYVLAFALVGACTLLAAAVAAVAMPRMRSSPEPGRSRGAHPAGSPGR